MIPVYNKVFSIGIMVGLLASTLSAVTNISYLFKNDTQYEVTFHGTLGTPHAGASSCLSSDFTINLYPRGSQYMARPCVVTSFDVHINKNGKRLYAASYCNGRGDTRNRKWTLKRTVTDGETQFHLVTE